MSPHPDHNIINFDDLQKGHTLPAVRLTQDLKPERVMEGELEGVIYRKGWTGRVIEIEPTGNHADCLPVLFEDYEHAVWIEKKYLESVK